MSCTIRYAEACVRDPAVFLEKVREIADRMDSRIVCFDADKLAGEKHAEVALRQAYRSFCSGEAISNSFEMEALLYAAGSRQCSVAVSFGLHGGENRLYVCCCPAPAGIWDRLAGILHFCGEPDEGITPAKAARLMDLFGISPAEIAAAGTGRLQDLVLERVALLEVNK
ncbi:KEOPS complex subunit Cgi121 [Methanoregula sp.]|uniref:KEOPS complex subunit Cgi121 n=1 Tax=Methanoregula sp. TaxID=2052170 RepID=UPI002BAFF0DD|nr:KEOPS complex subunit Cgi121 [Methanoregula sp.]HVP95695.1 KEOPS complex subunit Cgi121 [Methanoregula sp.]